MDNTCTCGECRDCKKDKIVEEFCFKFRILDEQSFIDIQLKGEINPRID